MYDTSTHTPPPPPLTSSPDPFPLTLSTDRTGSICTPTPTQKMPSGPPNSCTSPRLHLPLSCIHPHLWSQLVNHHLFFSNTVSPLPPSPLSHLHAPTPPGTHHRSNQLGAFPPLPPKKAFQAAPCMYFDGCASPLLGSNDVHASAAAAVAAPTAKKCLLGDFSMVRGVIAAPPRPPPPRRLMAIPCLSEGEEERVVVLVEVLVLVLVLVLTLVLVLVLL